MYTLIVILHVIVCIVLILVVLLQAGKGANMGAAFGGASQTIFGSAGPDTFLSKMTTAVAVIFMITSVSLSYIVAKGGRSVVEGAARPGVEKKTPLPIPQNVPAPPAKAPIGPVQNAPTGNK